MLDAAVALKPAMPSASAIGLEGFFPIEAQQPETSAASAHEPGRPPLIAWVEPAESFWLLSLRNFGLTLATFGIYHFWGRADARRQVVNSIRLGGKPLDYSGTGREAFVAFLIGAAVAVSIVLAFLMMFNQTGAGVEGVREFRWKRLFITLPLLFLLGSAVYRRRQHVLRRTWWLGERFDLCGHAWSYAWQHFWSAFLVPLTFGWAAPWRASRLEARKIAEMHHGDRRFRVNAKVAPLYRAFALLWLGGGTSYVLTMVLVGLVAGPQIMAALEGLTLAPLNDPQLLTRIAATLFVGLLPLLALATVYRAVWYEHLISSISFEGARFRLDLPKARFVGLALSNLALKLLSLGALAPVVEARFVRFMLAHTRVEGVLPEIPARASAAAA
jgi:uncharacterized membrane protein YjgN (DUF898 family)